MHLLVVEVCSDVVGKLAGLVAVSIHISLKIR